MSELQITGKNIPTSNSNPTTTQQTGEAEPIKIEFPQSISNQTQNKNSGKFDSNAYFNIQTEKQPKTDKKKKKKNDITKRTLYEYDRKSRLAKVTESDGNGVVTQITIYQYDENFPKKIASKITKDGNGNVINTYKESYDKYGRTIKRETTDEKGDVTTEEINPSEENSTTTFLNGKIIKETFGEYTIDWKYEENGNIQRRFTDQQGNLRRVLVKNPDGFVTGTNYNEQGEITHIEYYDPKTNRMNGTNLITNQRYTTNWADNYWTSKNIKEFHYN